MCGNITGRQNISRHLAALTSFGPYRHAPLNVKKRRKLSLRRSCNTPLEYSAFGPCRRHELGEYRQEETLAAS
eukprot:GDKH01015867.1.p1 GENE.GDKH01015867.1~~GDKH01015867.1.p1  ORF type:complete len:73 (-),score=2.21 GDKH01015867.1:477-695(-)